MAKKGTEDLPALLADLGRALPISSRVERPAAAVRFPTVERQGDWGIVLALGIFAIAGAAIGAIITIHVLGAPPWPQMSDWPKADAQFLWESYLGILLAYVVAGLATRMYFLRKAQLVRENPHVRMSEVVASLVNDFREMERSISSVLPP